MATFQQKAQGLLSDPLFNMGMGILGSNQGHYGAFGPALAGGLQQAQYAQQLEEQRKQNKIKNDILLAQQREEERKAQLAQQQAASLSALARSSSGLLGMSEEQAEQFAFADPKAFTGLLSTQSTTPTDVKTYKYSQSDPGYLGYKNYATDQTMAQRERLFHAGEAGKFARNAATNRATISAAGFKVPVNYMVDPSNPGQVIPIPGGPAVADADKNKLNVGVIASAKRDAEDAIKYYRDINEKPVTQREIALPLTEAREVKQKLFRVAATLLQAQSGAAVPESEVERFVDSHFPSILDSRDSVSSKLKALETKLGLGGKLQAAPSGGGEVNWSDL